MERERVAPLTVYLMVGTRKFTGVVSGWERRRGYSSAAKKRKYP
jgi:hypothetical protein